MSSTAVRHWFGLAIKIRCGIAKRQDTRLISSIPRVRFPLPLPVIWGISEDIGSQTEGPGPQGETGEEEEKEEMKICSRKYKLTFDRKQSGGGFWCHGRKSEGRGEICIGHYKSLRNCAEILCHEVVEAILHEDDKRFSVGREDTNATRQFQFDHDYLNGFGPKLADALLTSGMFKLKDCRPKKGKKRGHKC